MKKVLLASAVFAMSATGVMAQDFDDIIAANPGNVFTRDGAGYTINLTGEVPRACQTRSFLPDTQTDGEDGEATRTLDLTTTNEQNVAFVGAACNFGGAGLTINVTSTNGFVLETAGGASVGYTLDAPSGPFNNEQTNANVFSFNFVSNAPFVDQGASLGLVLDSVPSAAGTYEDVLTVSNDVQ